MNFEEFALAGFIIIGLVNGIKLGIDRDWKAFSLWLTAIVSGTLLGYLHWFGLPSAEVGLGVGISSSGLYKVAQKIGGN